MNKKMKCRFKRKINVGGKIATLANCTKRNVHGISSGGSQNRSRNRSGGA